MSSIQQDPNKNDHRADQMKAVKGKKYGPDSDEELELVENAGFRESV